MDRPQGQTRIAMRELLYNEHCLIQTAAMHAALEMLPTFPENKSLTIVDYGCGQGVNAIEPMEKILSSLPNGATASLVFEDTPWNDWPTLVETIYNKMHTISQPGRNIQLFLNLVPVGFYDHVVPKKAADVGLCWSSLNYLKVQPNLNLDPSAPPSEFIAARRKAFATAAHQDLIEFLKFRASEIREGGTFVAAVGGQKPDSNTRPTNTGMAPLQAAMLKLVRMGRLTATELAQFALFPSHERTPEELQNALAIPEVADLWEVETVEPKLIVHPAWETYQKTLNMSGQNDVKQKEALKNYAQASLQNLVSSSGWFWLEVLKKSRGSHWIGGQDLLEELTRVAVQEWVENFENMKVEIWYTYLRLKRKGANA
ncbi:hypothetical protein V2G26_003910 [Clonostachys chloroleuca]